MIFKVIKFFVKLGIGIMLGLLAFIFVVYVLFNAGKTYYEDSKLPYNDASYVVRAHQICEESEVGTDHSAAFLAAKRYSGRRTET